MKKFNLLFGVLILLVLLTGVNFVSAALCRGADGYYHDCDKFYYIGNDKVYVGEFYYDRDKYSAYYDYRNRYYANYVPRNEKKNYYYEGYDDYDIDEKKAYDRGFKDGTNYGDDLSYSRGYDIGYRDGYNYWSNYYQDNQRYTASNERFNYYSGYQGLQRAQNQKIIYFWRRD